MSGSDPRSTLLETPFVTLIAAPSLAVGIGSNSAIFCLFDQLLSLSACVPNRLVTLAGPGAWRVPKPCRVIGLREVKAASRRQRVEQAYRPKHL